MDNRKTEVIKGFGHQIEQRAEGTAFLNYKLAKGKKRWLLLIGIEPLEDESGNIIYRCLNKYDLFI